ncbi:MAG: hypothetical protein KF833_14610 [Verrucomicrobiae bacterium]|nr:hypothetical protein [Verrucomicrobiae bacterium]
MTAAFWRTGLVLAGMVAAMTAQSNELGIARDAAGVRLAIAGEDGREYSLEALEALLNDGREWRPVATVAPGPGPGPVFVYDPICSTRPQNFYRLRLLSGTVPVEVPNLRLLSTDGQAHELFYQTDTRALVLLLAGAGIGSLEGDAPVLRALAEHWGTRARFWIVAMGTGSDRARWEEEARGLGLDFTILEDEAGVVTRQLGRGRVPEAVLYDPAAYSVVYQGRIGGGPGDGVGTGGTSLLGEALHQHLGGGRVTVRESRVEGEPLPSAGFEQDDYARDIAPLLRRYCVECHSPGNIAPWAMTGHEVVRDFAPLMKDEILTRRMPPWHADRQAQRYSNDGMMSGEEVARLVAWIDRGAPRGDGPDPLAENVPPPPPEWPMGQPDRVLEIDEQAIPAAGTVDYRYVLIRNPYPTDVWLRAALVRPGNARVLHHVLVFTASGLNDILQIQAGLGGYFAAYVPGMEQVPFPEGTGKLLKQGAFLVFQLHYTATGQPETDRTALGLYLAGQPPERELLTAAAYDTRFVIPPGAADHPVTAEFRMPRDGLLYEMSPHMHYRGRWFRFEAVYPDERRETLLNVPFYRFDWQTLYRLETPKRLPAGTRIVVTGGWDNSIRNPYNPDPTASVRFGEQSWEEMFIGYFNWADAPAQ